MHIFIVNALLGKDLEIYGNPETKTLDFTYIDDFTDGVIPALNNPVWNKEYNISGNNEFKVYNPAKFIISETNSQSRIIVRDAEIAQPQMACLELDNIKKLRYFPKVSLEQGVRKNIKFYKELLKTNH